MLIISPHPGVFKEHAAAAVRLEAVFVGVDDDGVRLLQHSIGPAGGRGQVIRQNEIAAVS